MHAKLPSTRLTRSLLATLCAFAMTAPVWATEPISLKASQISSLGIQLATIQPQDAARQRFPAQVAIPTAQQRVVAAPVAGVIEALMVSTGDAVKAGQGLVRLRSPQIQELQRDVSQSGSQLDLAKRTAARDEALYQEGLIPLSRLEASRAQLAQQQALAQERRQTLALSGGVARPNADGSISLTAPLSGRVLEQLVAVGQRVEAATPLYRIAALDTLWVDIQVPAKLTSQIRLGHAVSVVSPDGGTVTGEVISLGATVDATTQTSLVRARVLSKGETGRLRPGELVEASVSVPGSDGVSLSTLPAQALVSAPGGTHHVFVASAPGRFVWTPVKVHSQSGASAVVSGLPAGSQVVVRGTAALKSLMAE